MFRLRFVLSTALLLELIACSESTSKSDTSDTGADTDSGDTGTMGDSAGSAEYDTSNDGSGSGQNEPTLAPQGRLRAEGTEIVDATGRPVRLRGVNLGGWLFHETWITNMDLSDYARAYLAAHESGVPDGSGVAVDEAIRAVGKGTGIAWQADFQAALTTEANADFAARFVALLPGYDSISDDSDLPFRQLLEDRFGTAGRDSLLDTFQGAWVGPSDIVWLKDHGFNLVRIPIGYRTLVTNSDLEDPTALDWNEAAFTRLTDLLDACAANGLYAVVDIQESPGGHNDYSGPARVYSEPAFADLTVTLWEELSRRLRNRDEVAAYSLLAEPFSAPSAAARDELYDRLHDAIRATGDDHLLVIHDGFFGMNSIPPASEFGWTGVVYSTHFFEWSIDSLQGYRSLMALSLPGYRIAQRGQGVPWFVGSFSTMQDTPWAYDAARYLTDTYETEGWSWSVWTYKRIDDPVDVALFGESTSWGVRGRLTADLPRPDVYEDSLETLQAKFRAYGDLDLTPNEQLLNALTGPR